MNEAGVDAGEWLRGGKRADDERMAEKLEVKGEVAEALGAGLWGWGGRREGEAVFETDERLFVAVVSGVRPRRELGWDAAGPQAGC